MLSFNESDVFGYQNTGDNFRRRILETLKAVNTTTVVNDRLTQDLDIIQKTYKELATAKAVAAVKANRIYLCHFQNQAERLPEIMPYVRAKAPNGDTMIVIDITQYLTNNPDHNPDTNDGVSPIRVNVPKLHDILIPAFFALELYGPKMVLPAEANKNMALLWAEMMNQVLARFGLFNSNFDRKNAFKYFHIRFYLKYYLQCADALVNSIATSAIKGGKNAIIDEMESNLVRLGIDPYLSFTDFMQAMFNSEVNGIRGLDASLVKTLNVPYFIKKYSEMFGPKAMSALYSSDYLFFVLYNSYRKSDIVRDRAFENITGVGKNSAMPQLLQSLFKEL